jgi:hypothetical protein
MPNLTRFGRANEKKKTSISSARLLFTDIPTAEAYQLFQLPAKCLIITTHVIVTIAGQAATTMDIDIEGGATISTADIATVAVDTDTVGVLTGTGAVITVTPSAILTSGSFQVIIEYIEYTLNNGEFTAYIT